MKRRRDGGATGTTTRRGFLKAAGAAAASTAAAPWIVPASVLGKSPATPPSERITIGAIGCGGRGSHHVRALLGHDDVRIVAACDADKRKSDAVARQVDARYGGKSGKGSGQCQSTSDFREVLARDDIDAVVVASPENWHALHAALAAEAGKDIYCEKALSLTVREGRRLCGAVRRHGRVLQVGTQQRSDGRFRRACELARNGRLGRLRRVEVGVPGGRALPVTPPAPVPEGLDYDLWLGPAPWTPYNKLKCSFNWYFISDYCAGWIQSWGVHHCDIALWGAPELLESPLRVEGAATFPGDGLADTSITWRVTCTAPSGLVFSFSDNAHHRQGVKFIGDEGWVHVRRGGIAAEPASLLTARPRPGDERLEVSRGHHRNFLECIRTRRDPVAPVEAGHRATALSLVADIATRLRRPLSWDWRTERFVGDDTADRMLARSMRPPWRM